MNSNQMADAFVEMLFAHHIDATPNMSPEELLETAATDLLLSFRRYGMDADRVIASATRTASWCGRHTGAITNIRGDTAQARAREMNAELPEDQQTILKLKRMIL